MLISAQVPEFVPSDKVKIETDPNAKGPPVDSAMAADDETRIDELSEQLESLRAGLPSGFRMAAIAFEKDDDSNHHMDLITALANNRARNYSIPEARTELLTALAHVEGMQRVIVTAIARKCAGHQSTSARQQPFSAAA